MPNTEFYYITTEFYKLYCIAVKFYYITIEPYRPYSITVKTLSLIKQ